MDLGTPSETPEIVQAADRLCRELGVEQSCLPETGRLLQVLVSGITDGRILELGTGCAYSTAWMAASLQDRDGTELITVDLNQRLTESAGDLLADWPRIDVRCGGWRTVLDDGPFQLIFVDVSEAKTAGVDDVIAALAPGGMAVLDDLTPVELWPDDWRGKPDRVREAWLNHSRLASTELRVTADHAVILGTAIS